MATAAEITRVTYRWDDPSGVEPGWYCEAWAGDQMVMDSQKIWFPVEVDGYESRADLEEALREAFPEAKIIRQ